MGVVRLEVVFEVEAGRARAVGGRRVEAGGRVWGL